MSPVSIFHIHEFQILSKTKAGRFPWQGHSRHFTRFLGKPRIFVGQFTRPVAPVGWLEEAELPAVEEPAIGEFELGYYEQCHKGEGHKRGGQGTAE